MANAEKGEVAFTVGGQGYTLVLGVNALCAAESETGLKVNELGANPGLSAIRALMWAGLQAYHPDLSIDDAGDLIQKLGMAEAAQKVSRAFQLAFPTEAAKGAAGPRKGARKGGTG